MLEQPAIGKEIVVMRKCAATVWLAVVTVFISGVQAGDVGDAQWYVNSLKMKFVRIEQGTFQMGQVKTPLPPEVTVNGLDFTRTGDFDEHPVHRVKITKPFYMGIVEVTNYQYELFDPEHKKFRGKYGVSDNDDEAVVYVNWYDAQRFCNWLSDLEQLPYRLPTEAEWEYACRAGTNTNYYAGDILPKDYLKMARRTGGPVSVSLRVGRTPPNKWGLYDMHGNVEEWCNDWYGPYIQGEQLDPAGYATGDCKITRGGSYGTKVYYLRSANRMSALPGTKSWLMGFRVVIGQLPKTELLKQPIPPHQKYVQQQPASRREAYTDKPYFKGPRKFVNIPTDWYGPIFASHNHGPSIAPCPNGDLLATWFSTVTEGGREPVQAGAKLRYGREEWDQASLFWDTADRNNTGTSLWFDGDKTIYHFTGASFAGASKCMLAMRKSADSGRTWSGARILLPEFERGQVPSNKMFRMHDDTLAFPVDLNGAGLWMSRDEGLTWFNPGGIITGVHAAVAQLYDGRILAFGRSGEINGKMPMSISTDLGQTYTYYASEFPPIGGQQKCVLRKLQQGPLFFASFADNGTEITDAAGVKRTVRGLFAALSMDDGKTWINKRLVTDDGPGLPVEGTAGGLFMMSQRNAEYRGYMCSCQGLDGLIHLITSREHYTFNLKWLETPQPAIKYPPVKVTHVVENFDGPQKFDLNQWADYHAYKGGFNGKGQYTIDALGPLGGINRLVGKGSLEMMIEAKNFYFYPTLSKNPPGFTLWFKDDRVRTLKLDVRKFGIGVGLSDKIGKLPKFEDKSKLVSYTQPPSSFKLRLLYDEKSKRVRIYYGLNGDAAISELPESKAGVYFGEPLTESAAAFLLFSSGRMDLDRFEVKPINP